jgi:CHAT domain-containing protein/tetratricopeptide (TPR) repeat protein
MQRIGAFQGPCRRGFGLLVLAASALAGSSNDALQRADRSADLYNWVLAGPLYKQAESQLHADGNQAGALYAHIGYLRSTMETSTLPQLSAYLRKQLDSPLVTANSHLQFLVLRVKADVDAEIDSSPAKADWQQANQLAVKEHDRRWESRTIGEIGFQQYVLGDHLNARKAVAEALLFAHKTGDFAAEIRFLSGIGTALGLGGSPDEGLQFLDRALGLASAHPDTGFPYMASAGKTMALIAKFQSSHAIRDLDAARLLVSTQILQAQKEHRIVKLTQARLFDADIAIEEGNDTKAIQILLRTAQLGKVNQGRLLADAYSKLTTLYRKSGQLKIAQIYASKAIAMTGESRDMYLAPERIIALAQLSNALHQYRKAEELYGRAIDIVEGLLAQNPEPAIKEAMLTAMSQVYVDYFALAAKHRNAVEAYEIIEHIRGRILAEVLQAKPGGAYAETLDPAVEDQIANLKLALVKASSTRQRQKVLDDLFYAQGSRWTSEFAKTNNVRIKPVSLSRVQNSLGTHEALLEYVLAEPASFCLVIDRNSAHIVSLAPKHQIEREAASYRQLIKTKQPVAHQSELLGDLLLGSIENLREYKALTIVPDGALHYIPFDTLTSPQGSGLVATEYTISYTPSAASEYFLRTRNRERGTRSFLGVGGVAYNDPAKPVVVSQTRSPAADDEDDETKPVPDLPGSADEVETAADLMGGPDAKLQTGTKATAQAFKDEPLGSYRIIHLAVHAKANLKNPEDSALRLRSNWPHDSGLIDAREISQFHLNAGLVVLSACDTAIGRLQGQEGTWNLARSFIIAGADSVVSTLWPVDDAYSQYLMKQFYIHLSRGEEKATALRLAKVDLLTKFGADTPPLYWAGFLIMGDGNRPAMQPKVTFQRSGHLIQ